METTQTRTGISGILEQLVGGYIAVETLRNSNLSESGQSNSPSEHLQLDTGRDSDGTTLVSRLVPGVSNGALAAGTAVIAVMGLLTIAYLASD